MPRDLRNRVLVITGASSGIGAATALAAADAGMRTVITARRGPRLEAVADRIRARGGEAETVIGDVSEPGLERRLLDAAEARYGGFDAVFANAGFGMERGVMDTDEDVLREMFEVNFFASVRLLREAARRLIDDGRPGHLLMCSSCLAKFTLPYHAAYSASKSAQAHICRAMAHELAPEGIHVSSVHPVTTTTEFFAESARRTGRTAPPDELPEHAPKWLIQPPERVADAVIRCLRSPRSEVWTSRIVQYSAGLLTAFPWLLDIVLRREAERTRRAERPDAAPGSAPEENEDRSSPRSEGTSLDERTGARTDHGAGRQAGTAVRHST